MITYTYECQSCKAVCTAQQKITDVAWEKCPRCEKPALRRLITNGAFILKGDCWEKDGYQ